MTISLKELGQFVSGEKDAKAGNDALEGESDYYYRGYAAEYALAEANTAMTEIMEKKR
tara:strand:- start:491 stop:664 length:174 start_codon:yes stop_codon:yes gene_type:complete